MTLQERLDESYQKGKEEGYAQSYERGYAQGYERGYAQNYKRGYELGKRSKALQISRNLVKATALSDREISEMVDGSVTAEEVAMLRKGQKVE